MLVIDGMPGAGKTTTLGTVIARCSEVVVFPEAQPPERGDDDTVMRRLLAEDYARTEAAHRIRTHSPHRLVASDRCHLGVFAYRYALARLTGEWADFERALTRGRELALDERHHDDIVLILHLDPDKSLRHRRGRAGDPRYRTWYDPVFLTYYAEFFRDLHRWTEPGPHWAHHHAADPTISATLHALLPTPITPPAAANGDLHCGRDCGSPRSATVATPDAAAQLWSRGLHHQRPGEGVRCLRGAAAITAHTGDLADERSQRRRQPHPAGDIGART
ncbi:hypothetical protein GCM10009676_18620 [Prauserella halophila]|uniref:Thymidylate kinase n=1 Tax=Prauserella halophila TaxID=185641 RepID=A0ABP4GR37_9PSEU|nr:hypothetical protein [Prauserella halophila]MCP2235936.1 Thymidylate kinase [Prauserella halophila]